jgi:Domain of unknown function (DUF4262)
LSDPRGKLAATTTEGRAPCAGNATTPIGTTEDYFDEVRERIRTHGWMVQYVECNRTPFAYTIGLHDWGLPELLITAVSPQRATRLLNAVARDAVTGRTLTSGQQIKLTAGPLIEIVEMKHPDVHLKFAVAFGGPEIRALQLVWADGRGRWPWSAAFCDGRRRQPVLGIRSRAT